NIASNSELLHQSQKRHHRSSRSMPTTIGGAKPAKKSRTDVPSCGNVFAKISPVSRFNIAIVCCAACKSQPTIRILASFDLHRCEHGYRTVYAGRREANVVMTSFWRRSNFLY